MPRLTDWMSRSTSLCANLVASAAIDHSGPVGVPEHALSSPRLDGCAPADRRCRVGDAF